MSKIILDLCGGTGSWSKPYRDAGYDVRIVDLPMDVRMIEDGKVRMTDVLDQIGNSVERLEDLEDAWTPQMEESSKWIDSTPADYPQGEKRWRNTERNR